MDKRIMAITQARPFLIAEIKTKFLTYLPSYLSTQERRERIGALNVACNEVMLMNPVRFDGEE